MVDLVMDLRRRDGEMMPKASPQPPRAWPYGSREAWIAWRAFLEGRIDPFSAQQRSECDRELARIARCESTALPARPQIVPWRNETHPH